MLLQTGTAATYVDLIATALDIDFWPQAHEAEQLRPDWDWEDDPFIA